MRCKSNLSRYFQNENTLMSKTLIDTVLTSQKFGSNQTNLLIKIIKYNTEW